MYEHVRQIIQRFQLITSGECLVIGVSGGADSIALLHVLNRILPKRSIRIHAATLDHRLRGEESADDVRFVEELCRALGVTLTVGKADVAGLAHSQKLSIETAARIARYDFLATVARAEGAMRIAVAHHADDQAETVMMHILRGSGVHGLAGMMMVSPVIGHPDLSVIRPLLGVTRGEIEVYCKENQLVPRQDSTNADTSMLRNAIRIEVLPFLKRYAPHINSTLGRLAEIAATEDALMQEQVNVFTTIHAKVVVDEEVVIPRRSFLALHVALQRRVIIWAVDQVRLSEDISSELVIASIELVAKGKHGAIALLGGKVCLRIEYDQLVVERVGAVQTFPNMPLLTEGQTVPMTVPAAISVGGWVLHAGYTVQENAGIIGRLAVEEYTSIILRTRQDGDVFAPLGMGGHHQKVSRWMVNRKIPADARNKIPLLEINGMVAAICWNGQWSISELFAVKNTKAPIIYFTFLENL